MFDLASTVLAVDPVPWARSQMAFTLATHIILVPLGVSWAAMALIANYRGIKHDDADALLLAQPLRRPREPGHPADGIGSARPVLVDRVDVAPVGRHHQPGRVVGLQRLPRLQL